MVKRIAGVLYPDSEAERFAWVLDEAKRLWGEPDLIGEPIPFTLTDYYRDIAPCLMRRFICFRGLADAGGLADWKRAACALEARSRTPRAVNVDPKTAVSILHCVNYNFLCSHFRPNLAFVINSSNVFAKKFIYKSG